jgi:COMPASS component SWD3
LYDLSVTGSGSGRGGGGGKTTKTQQQQPRGGKCAKTYAGHTNTKYCTFASFLVSSSSNLNNIDNSSSSNLNNIDNNNNNYCRRRARSCVISGSEDGKVYLYDLQSRLIQQTLEGHTDAVLAVDAHDTLELIGSGGMANDKCVRFWAPL